MTVVALEQPGPQTAALAIRPGQEMWTDKQKAALGVLGIREASNADLAVFMHYCQKTGLDPFSRQIYLIKRREKVGDQWVDKWTIQVGIDGFRVVRDRVAERLGVTVEYEDTIWFDRNGGEHKIWLLDEPPAGCKVTVLKDGRPFPAVLRFGSYAARKNGELTGQWKNQPDHMIEKCAEAFALRRAFPNDLSGVYLEDEMPRQDEPGGGRPRGRVTVAEVVGRGPVPVDENGEVSAPEPPALQAPVATEAADGGALTVEDPPDWPEVTRPGTGTPVGS